jgi:hypothetical protein
MTWKKFIRKIVSTLQISLNQGLISPGISMLRAFIFSYLKTLTMKVKSSLHTNKQILTVGEVVDMVKNKSWKKDVSYMLTEVFDHTNGKWRELEPLERFEEVTDLDFNEANGTLDIQFGPSLFDFQEVSASTLFQELMTIGEEFRCTAYST